MRRSVLVLFALLPLCGAAATPPSPAPQPLVREVMTRALPEQHGKEALILTVEYPPGGADPVHRHDAHGFVYVLEARARPSMRARPICTP